MNNSLEFKGFKTKYGLMVSSNSITKAKVREPSKIASRCWREWGIVRIDEKGACPTFSIRFHDCPERGEA